MPITGPASFVPTANQFLAHWPSANAAAGASPIVLKGGIGVADLEALRDTLLARRAGVEAALNGREGVRADLEAQKALMLLWLNWFNAKLEAVCEIPKWLAIRPGAYSQGDAMGKVIPPLDDVADVWARYQAVEPVLTLMDGTTLADFKAGLALLKNLYVQYASEANAVALARADRNETQEEMRAVVVGYRQRIGADFPEGSVILETLPRYTPLAGHTPKPVAATGSYDAEKGMAELSWTKSNDPKLVGFEVRAVAGPEYDAQDESVVAHISKDAPRRWSGVFGLGVPGAEAAFRIYVMTSTGNERGSNTVALKRPPE